METTAHRKVIDSVDPAKRRTYSMEGESFDYALLIAIPPHRGPQVVFDPGIGDEDGYTCPPTRGR